MYWGFSAFAVMFVFYGSSLFSRINLIIVASVAFLTFLRIVLDLIHSEDSNILKYYKRKALMIYESYEKDADPKMEDFGSEFLKDIPPSDLISHKERLERAYDDATKAIEDQGKVPSLMGDLVDFSKLQSFCKPSPSRIKL